MSISLICSPLDSIRENIFSLSVVSLLTIPAAIAVLGNSFIVILTPSFRLIVSIADPVISLNLFLSETTILVKSGEMFPSLSSAMTR